MKLIISALVAAGLAAGVAQADVNTVSIGLPGNTNDVTGFGAVNYTYSIGQFELTSDQFFASGLGGAAGENTPIINISWHDAAKFCNWMTTGTTSNGAYTISGGLVTDMMTRSEILTAGGVFYVLPTLDEWYKAAYYDALGGTGYSLYADGTSDVPGIGTDVNYSSANIAVWDVGSGYDEQNGTKDMMGNAYEWLENSGSSAGTRLVTGGSWASDLQSLKNVSSHPAVGSGLETDQLGFRVVAIPEPGTLSLMGLSTLSLFFTRSLRRRKRAGKSLFPIRKECLCDTYCSIDEWDSTFNNEMDSIGFLHATGNAFLPSLQVVWSKVHARYRAIDRVFWNRMVVLHEKRVAARKAFRKALKRNALACFDGFLSLIMK